MNLDKIHIGPLIKNDTKTNKLNTSYNKSVGKKNSTTKQISNIMVKNLTNSRITTNQQVPEAVKSLYGPNTQREFEIQQK